MRNLMASNIDRPRIDSLQALRALAFLGIFFVHAKFFIHWSALGVSIFFVMSGFLMVYSYEGKPLMLSLKNNAKFSMEKIRKLYPLHILTMLFGIVLTVLYIVYFTNDGITRKSIIALFCKVGLNVTLMQTWFPRPTFSESLNVVAWYLSVTMFLYFIFPWLRAFVKKFSKAALTYVCLGLLCMEIVSCILVISFFGSGSPVYLWFTYSFPVFRIGDFFVGCVLAKWYFDSDLSCVSFFQASCYETIIAIITVLVLVWTKKDHENIVLQALRNNTTIYIPLAACWIFLFTLNKGVITKLFVNDIFIYIGNISAYLFLIHYIITQYVNITIRILTLDINGLNRTILVGIELAVSIFLSICYKRIVSRKRHSC